MKRLIIISLVLASILSMSLSIKAKELGEKEFVTVSTKEQINIDLRYSGDRIYFFGTVPEKGADVVVKLISSATEHTKLTQKGKVGLFWMGTKQYEISNIPFMYKIHSSGKLNSILTTTLAKELGIGYEILKGNMELKLVKGEAPEERDIVFDGFVKMKEKDNLYRIAEQRIKITQERVFQHYFTFPQKAKEGTYKIISYVIKGGKLLAMSNDTVVIQKVGMEGWLTRMARNYGLAYGIMAVIVAVSAGLLVGLIFKGGGH